MRVRIRHDPQQEFQAVSLDIIPEDNDETRLLHLFEGSVPFMIQYGQERSVLQLNIHNRIKSQN